jgi:hypothetical protein
VEYLEKPSCAMGCGISQAEQKKARPVPEVRGPQREELTKKRDAAEDALRSFMNVLPPEQRPSSSSSRRQSRASVASNTALAYLRHMGIGGGHTNNTGRAAIESFRVSQTNFREKSQTLIIFDWDDTIFPTFWFKDKKKGTNKNKKIRSDESTNLEDLSNAVIDLLQVSMEVGHAVLITNAKRPWVDICAWKIYKNYQLDKLLREIPILYATEFVDLTENSKDIEDIKKTMASQGHDMNAPDRLTEETQQKMTTMLLTQTKAKAMKEALLAFYASYEGQSWKNVITLGDAMFEHDAIKKVISERPADMQEKRCRVKTIKFLEAPSLEGLKDEVVVATRWLKKIAELEDDADIEIGKSLEAMIELDKVFGPGKMEPFQSEKSEGFASNGFAATPTPSLNQKTAVC